MRKTHESEHAQGRGGVWRSRHYGRAPQFSGFSNSQRSTDFAESLLHLEECDPQDLWVGWGGGSANIEENWKGVEILKAWGT